jgi:hypothetical protein
MGVAIRVHDANNGGDWKVRGANVAHRPAQLDAKARTRTSHSQWPGPAGEALKTSVVQEPRSSSPSRAAREYVVRRTNSAATATDPLRPQRNLVSASLGDILSESDQIPARWDSR